MSHPNLAPTRRNQLVTAALREALAPAANLGLFAKTPHATWERDLGVVRLQLQAEAAPSAQQWRRRTGDLFTAKRPLGLIRRCRELRQSAAKLVRVVARHGAACKGCPRSDCGSGSGCVRWICRGRVAGIGRAEMDQGEEAEIMCRSASRVGCWSDGSGSPECGRRWRR